MAVTITHNKVATLPDEPGAEVQAAEWNDAHAVAGLGTMAEQAAADYTTTAGLTAYLASPPAIGGTAAAAVTGTTITATTKVVSADANGFGFAGSSNTQFYRGASQGGNGIIAKVAGTDQWTVGQNSGIGTVQIGPVTWATAISSTADAVINRVSANSLLFGTTTATTTSRTEINKTVTGIADATATAVFTVTVPNAAHSANIEVTLNGSLGAGGAIGADEAGASIKYNVMVNRTAGVNAVAVISAAYASSGSAGVAGSNTCTVTGDLGAITGAVGAANTFTIRVTVTKGSGSSANHTCTAHAVLVNKNATGVTIA